MAEGYNLKLQLIGSNFIPALQNLENYIEKHKLNKFVIIKNQIDFKKINNEYKNSNIQIAPSFCESFGITVIESGNLSIPLICSNIQIFKEITDKNVYLFNPYNEFDLAEKIKKVVHEKAERQKKIRGLYKFVAKNFSWKKVSDQTFDFILK